MPSSLFLRTLLPAAVLMLAVAGNAQPMKPAPKPASGASAKAAPAAPKGNPTAVTVGTVAIKKGKIDTLAVLMARARGADLQDLPPEQAAMLLRMVATNLIGQELMELEAKARGIQAAPREIDSAVKVLKSQFPDNASWLKALRQSGDTEAQMRGKVAKQIRSDKVLAASVTPPAPPTEAELRAFWDANRKEFPISDSLRAVQILVLADAKTSTETAGAKKRRLEALREELLEDSANIPVLLRSFMQAAARNGEGPEAKIGGDLERFHPDDFNPEFKAQAMKLRVGQMSPVFRTPLGFHLILLVEKYDGKYDSYKLQSLQNLSARKNMELGQDMRDFLKKMAAKHKVKYPLPAYRDQSESGIY